MRKHRLRVDPGMIDEIFTKKKTLFRSASTEALLRQRDVLAFEALNPVPGHQKARGNFDLRSMKSKDASMQLDSQRSEFLDDDYEKIVDKFMTKNEELHRYQHYEDVPDMEEVLH